MTQGSEIGVQGGMSGTAELIYKTTSPDALAWLADYTKRDEAVRKVQGEFQIKMTEQIPVPEGEGPRRALVTVNSVVVGIGFSYDEFYERGWKHKENLPTGWRVSRDWTRTLVPNKGTRAGKALAAEMNALPWLDLRIDMNKHIGAPSSIWTDSYRYTPGFSVDRDENDQPTALWLTWGSGQCEKYFFQEIERAKQHSGVTADVEWEEIPRSVWYARQEALAAEKTDENEEEED